MKGGLSIKKIGRTGRSGFHQIEDHPTAHAAVQSFVGKLCSGSKSLSWYWVLLRHPIAWKLFKQVGEAAQNGLFGSYFRSRRFENDSQIPLASDFGPPSLENQKGDGRYSEERTRVLYLSATRQTAAVESRYDKSKPRIFVQQFDFSLPEIKVLRLANNLEERFPHLHYLLLASEYLPDESPFSPNPYRATNFVAFLCRMHGISAVEYPSLRGNYKDNPNAINIVLFGNTVDEATLMTSGIPTEFYRID